MASFVQLGFLLLCGESGDLLSVSLAGVCAQWGEDGIHGRSVYQGASRKKSSVRPRENPRRHT